MFLPNTGVFFMQQEKLWRVFEPLVMPNLTVKNRFYMAPMGTTFDDEHFRDYLVARAKGDVGLITTGIISVHPSGRAGAEIEPRLEKDDDIKKLEPLTRAVREAGARIVAQLNHTGRYSFCGFEGIDPVAPSPVYSSYSGNTPRELTTAEVDDLVEAFARAALRARKAGFDGIEFCGSSGYLISQFLSPVTNLRQDKYGGDTVQRAAFLLSILRETRNMVGPDFNICVKFDGEDGVEGGRTLEDALLIAPLIVEAGADRLHVWAGWHEATRPMLPMWVPRGAFSYLAEAVKRVVSVPVSTVGRINDPFTAEEILASGKADLIGLGRTLLCDPEFVKKAREGRLKEIRRCLACCYCFDTLMGRFKGQIPGLKCAFNPELGHEGEKLVKPASKPRRILVVGGGPAGMEAARDAALRGHDVTLMEKATKLGGMLNVAVIPPHKEELQNLIDFYTNEMELRKVKVRLGEEVTPETIAEIRPDTVVLAAGATPLIPRIPGVEQDHVVTAVDVLQGKAELSGKVVVIGGGLIGLETAEYLADKGFNVSVVEMLKSVAADVGPTTRWGFLARVRGKFRIMTLARVTEITKAAVVISDAEGKTREIPADTVVLAVGLSSRKDLIDALNQAGVEFHEIGCCRTPGQIAPSIAEAFAVACDL
jgi:2,4-dienoyl-CoA reductase-like NADH-dependent reductase (Old Yellow Enzyme family)/thioredoxin reductase